MAPLPVQVESTPLFLPIGGKHCALTRGAVHELLKAVFEQTAQRLRQRGPDLEATADRLIHASAHWLQHTAGSHMANKAVDLRHVRDNLDHESLSATGGYRHSSDDERHREAEEKHKIGW